jgi:hypothetical protein
MVLAQYHKEHLTRRCFGLLFRWRYKAAAKRGVMNKEKLMTKADELNFEKTPKDSAKSIISSASDVSNPSTWIAQNGDSAELRHDGQKVQVRDIAVKPDGSLEGEIFDFTHLGAIEYAGLELNQKITFAAKHVFHVTRENP